MTISIEILPDDDSLSVELFWIEVTQTILYSGFVYYEKTIEFSFKFAQKIIAS